MEIPEPTGDLDRLVADLGRTGVAVVADAIDRAQVESVRARLVALAEAERAAGTALLDDGASASGDYPAGANQRLLSLLEKDRAFWALARAHAPLHAARRLFGESYGYPSAIIDRYHLDAAMLSSITANIACLGGHPMELHADQGFAPPSVPFALLLNVVWPLVDFTDENGATRVVPGSHLRPTDAIEPDCADALAVDAPAGSAILIDGRTWHGTGANRTTSPRPAVLATYCRPWVRPFANHLLEISGEQLAGAPSDLLELVGARPWFVYGHGERKHLDTFRRHGSHGTEVPSAG